MRYEGGSTSGLEGQLRRRRTYFCNYGSSILVSCVSLAFLPIACLCVVDYYTCNVPVESAQPSPHEIPQHRQSPLLLSPADPLQIVPPNYRCFISTTPISPRWKPILGSCELPHSHHDQNHCFPASSPTSANCAPCNVAAASFRPQPRCRPPGRPAHQPFIIPYTGSGTQQPISRYMVLIALLSSSPSSSYRDF
jgi:hypothetical protein